MDLQLIASVFQVIAFAANLARQLARLTGGHEACMQAIRHRCADHEASGLGADDFRHARILEMLGDGVDGRLKTVRVLQQRGDVLEHHARLRIIDDVGDVAFEIERRHGGPFLEYATWSL